MQAAAAMGTRTSAFAARAVVVPTRAVPARSGVDGFVATRPWLVRVPRIARLPLPFVAVGSGAVAAPAVARIGGAVARLAPLR